MKKDKTSPFGLRLLEAFGYYSKGEIAEALRIGPSALTNYIQGRIPDAETLERISDMTGYSIHWLVTGKGAKRVFEGDYGYDDGFEEQAKEKLLEVLRTEIDRLFDRRRNVFEKAA